VLSPKCEEGHNGELFLHHYAFYHTFTHIIGPHARFGGISVLRRSFSPSCRTTALARTAKRAGAWQRSGRTAKALPSNFCDAHDNHVFVIGIISVRRCTAKPLPCELSHGNVVLSRSATCCVSSSNMIFSYIDCLF
jgi:hypothetical protein